MVDFQIVERLKPQRIRSGKYHDVCLAVVASVESGKAVRVPLTEGKTEHSRLQNAVRMFVSRYHNGLSVHSRTEPDYAAVIFWASQDMKAGG